jgi:hypothetical protein
MPLTPLQYKVLKLYRQYDMEGFTTGLWLRSSLKRWLLIVAATVVTYSFILPVLPVAGWLYIGLLFGVMLSGLAQYRLARRMWPVTKEIVDWNRVYELIELHENPMA